MKGVGNVTKKDKVKNKRVTVDYSLNGWITEVGSKEVVSGETKEKDRYESICDNFGNNSTELYSANLFSPI